MWKHISIKILQWNICCMEISINLLGISGNSYITSINDCFFYFDVTCDLWPVTCDLWPVTCDLWPVTCDLWPVTCKRNLPSFIMCSSPEKELNVKTIKDQFQIGECNKRSSDLLKSVTVIVIKIWLEERTTFAWFRNFRQQLWRAIHFSGRKSTLSEHVVQLLSP